MALDYAAATTVRGNFGRNGDTIHHIDVVQYPEFPDRFFVLPPHFSASRKARLTVYSRASTS